MIEELINLDKTTNAIHTALAANNIPSYGIFESIGDGFRNVLRNNVVLNPDNLEAEDRLNADIISVTQPYSYPNYQSDVKNIDQFLEKWGDCIKR